jgi:hypothetical protein
MSSRLYTIIICGLTLEGIEILKTEPVLIVVRFSLRILSDYQDIIRLFSGYYQIILRILSDYSQDIIRLFSGYYQIILSISSVVFTLYPPWCSQ